MVILGNVVAGLLVALRKESVDRNFYYSDKDADWVRSLSARRAWIEIIGPLIFSVQPRSLSARRAWIEIMDDFEPSTTRRVALRKESVDRNSKRLCNALEHLRSLSARRAWIEMSEL